MDSIALALYLLHVLPWAATERARPSSEGLRRYWLSSLCRFDAWTSELSTIRRRQEALSWSQKANDFRNIRPVLEDVLLTEPATRLFAAAATAYPHEGSEEDAEILYLARSTYERHLEARRRTLRFMVYGQGFDLSEAVELNRLRRRMERLADVALAIAAPWCRADRFAHDRAFVRRAAGDTGAFVPARALWIVSAIWQEERVALRRFAGTSFRPDLAQGVLQGAIETFGGDAFDDGGSLKRFATTSFSLAAEGKPQPPRRPVPPPAAPPRPKLGSRDLGRRSRG